MFNYFLIPVLLAVPPLLAPVKSYRKGLVTGLFISFIFLTAEEPILLSVPLSAAVFMFFICRRTEVRGENAAFYVKKPGAALLSIFLLTMVTFCAFGDAFYNYGQYIRVSEEVLLFTGQAAPAAVFAGPVLIGDRYDRKGPFHTIIFLTLLSAFSVLLAGCGGQSELLFVLGNCLIYLCISGFFVMMPLTAASFFGREHFFQLYFPIAFNAGLLWTGARYFYNRSGDILGNPGDFLLSLMFLVLISAFSAIFAWKRRFALVRPPRPVRPE